MAKIAVRLSNTGTLYSNVTLGVVFNEVNQNHISIAPNGVYAVILDEVTGTQNARAMQQLNTGILRVSGVFDEVSGIS
jgi:hypothetical protein